MAEYQIKEECLALVLDGYGYGINGESWGGELLKCSSINFERIGHLQEIALPGGDKATQEPWRLALSLSCALELDPPDHIKKQNNFRPLQHLIYKNFFSKTSSMGRLFDAVSAYLDLCHTASFEGEPAMLLEGIANRLSWTKIKENFIYFSTNTEVTNITRKEDVFQSIFSLEVWLAKILNNKRLTPKDKAIIFHETLIAKISAWVLKASSKLKLTSIILSGGCFQNQHLSCYISRLLNENGCKVYMSHKLPVNDASISVGQAWIAAHQHIEGKRYVFSDTNSDR